MALNGMVSLHIWFQIQFHIIAGPRTLVIFLSRVIKGSWSLPKPLNGSDRCSKNHQLSGQFLVVPKMSKQLEVGSIDQVLLYYVKQRKTCTFGKGELTPDTTILFKMACSTFKKVPLCQGFAILSQVDWDFKHHLWGGIKWWYFT